MRELQSCKTQSDSLSHPHKRKHLNFSLARINQQESRLNILTGNTKPCTPVWQESLQLSESGTWDTKPLLTGWTFPKIQEDEAWLCPQAAGVRREEAWLCSRLAISTQGWESGWMITPFCRFPLCVYPLRCEPLCLCLSPLLESENPEGRMVSRSPCSILRGEHLRDARWMADKERLSEKSLASDNTKW